MPTGGAEPTRIISVSLPGSWIQIPKSTQRTDIEAASGENVTGALDSQWDRDALTLVRTLASTFEESNLALILFEDAHAAWRSEWTRLRSEIDAPRKAFRHRQEDESRIEQNAGLPLNMLRMAMHLHARSFLFGLDRFSKLLDTQAATEHAPVEVKGLPAEFEAAFPDVLELRNSAHHPEDRILWRGRRKRDKTFDRLPAGYLATDGLAESEEGHLYMATMVDGTQGRLLVGTPTLHSLADLLQRAMRPWTWVG
jgi:hypothetical protein